uniref:DC_STAMP domain-containing protein n=1 Tax=Parastrongyloides trichosuri TaxID=131310 RepID=A0A0N4ZAM4_PARTI
MVVTEKDLENCSNEINDEKYGKIKILIAVIVCALINFTMFHQILLLINVYLEVPKDEPTRLFVAFNETEIFWKMSVEAGIASNSTSSSETIRHTNERDELIARNDKKYRIIYFLIGLITFILTKIVMSCHFKYVLLFRNIVPEFEEIVLTEISNEYGWMAVKIEIPSNLERSLQMDMDSLHVKTDKKCRKVYFIAACIIFVLINVVMKNYFEFISLLRKEFLREKVETWMEIYESYNIHLEQSCPYVNDIILYKFLVLFSYAFMIFSVISWSGYFSLRTVKLVTKLAIIYYHKKSAQVKPEKNWFQHP